MFDLDAGPVTITLPDTGKRFMSLQVINEDMYSPPATYAPAKRTFNRKKVGTRLMLMRIRTLVDPNSPADMDKVHALQDALKIEQMSSGKFEVPKWDTASLKSVIELGPTAIVELTGLRTRCVLITASGPA